jgi:hypothetical protein
MSQTTNTYAGAAGERDGNLHDKNANAIRPLLSSMAMLINYDNTLLKAVPD